MGAALIGSFICRGVSKRELIKISGNINGIQEDMTHIVEHLQDLYERLKTIDLAIQILNNYQLSVGSSCSAKWRSDVRAGQGRRFSTIFFNVGRITMPFWDSVANNVIFADDCCSVVHGSSMEELNEK